MFVCLFIPRNSDLTFFNLNDVNNTVEPVYNGPVLSGHPLLSGQFLKSQFFAHTNAVFVTCIRRPPLLSGRGHPVAVPCLSFFVIFTCIRRPPLKLSHMHSTMDNRNCRWRHRQSTTCSTNKSFKFRGAKRTCPTCLSRCNSYPIPILTWGILLYIFLLLISNISVITPLRS